jgi:hypothetical protein
MVCVGALCDSYVTDATVPEETSASIFSIELLSDNFTSSNGNEDTDGVYRVNLLEPFQECMEPLQDPQNLGHW